MVEWNMKEGSYDQIDDLLTQIRLCLVRLRETDPATTDELKGLLIQLEDWVELLVIDSLKLKSLESRPGTKSKKPLKDKRS